MKVLDSSRRNALVFLIIGGVSAGFSSIFIRLCLYPPSVIAAFRLLLPGLALTPFCLSSLRRVFREKKIWGFLLLIVPGVLLGLHFQFWVVGIKQTYVASGTFMFTISPVFFALFERIIYRKKISAAAYVSLLLVFLGALWMFEAGRGRIGRIGDLLCFISMLLFVVYLIVSREVSRSVPHLTYVQIIYLWGGLLTLPFAIAAGDVGRINSPGAGSMLALLGLAFIPTLIGHTAGNYGVRFFLPLTVSFFTLLEPIVATFAAAFILNEVPSIREFPAYLLFLSATVLYLLKAKRQ